jgi:hypothetical protein
VLCDTRFVNCPRSAADPIETRRGFAELSTASRSRGFPPLAGVDETADQRPERIAPDLDRRIGRSDLAELHLDVALACTCAHGVREHANADRELRRHLSSIACMIEGTPAITITLPIQKPGAPDTTLLRMRSAPLGMRIMRRRASVHRGAGRLHPFVQDGERARSGVDRRSRR